MKYSLAFDKGQVFKNNDRFIRIHLNSIHDKLEQDNNLQSLVTFTTTFKSAHELKEFLKTKGINPVYLKYEPVILYKKDYFRFMRVPYQSDLKYLSDRNLEKIIYEHANDKGFLEVLISNYANYPHLSNEMYSFRSYLSNPYASYKLYDVIRMFVDKVCFRNNNGKRTLNYKGMLDLGMLLSLVLKKAPKPQEEVNKKSIFDEKIDEDDIRYHKLEELKDRYKDNQDDQMRLF